MAAISTRAGVTGEGAARRTCLWGRPFLCPGRSLLALARRFALSLASKAKQPATPSAGDLLQSLVVRCVDGEGKPVAGVHVADRSIWSRHATPPFDEAGWAYSCPHAVSDEEGVACLRENLESLSCLVARHVARQLVALLPLEPQQLPAAITLTMQPECRVSGRLVCRELETRHRKVTWIAAYLYAGKVQPVCCLSEQAQFHFFVPPGTYRLHAYGGETVGGWKTFQVAPGVSELELEPIHVTPERLVQLEGRPAPELREIVAWKNGGPLRLADLRGRVVLLHFWGHWCGPGVREMPEIFALSDQYRERGLVVISIHVDGGEGRADSAAKLEEKLVATRRRLWAGRDLPFPVAFALEEWGPVRTDGKKVNSCRLAEDYGVYHYPTAVLIDRQGRVVKRFETGDPASEALLVQTLEASE